MKRKRKDQQQVTAIMSSRPSPLESTEYERKASVSIIAGDGEGAVYEIGAGGCVIGRTDEADIVLPLPGLSRRHVRISHQGDDFTIEDLGSTNGTSVEGSALTGARTLKDRDRIELGGVVLRFALQDELAHEAERRRYELSVRDGLTALFNRRHFDTQLESEFSYAMRHETELCVIMLDIDHFKSINDRWGHPAGDMVLREVSLAMKELLRAEDLLARYGGEEFVVLARGIPAAGAATLAERMRATVEGLHLEFEGQHIPVTISLGLASYRGGAGFDDQKALVGAADDALYEAKRAGRNRVHVNG